MALSLRSARKFSKAALLVAVNSGLPCAFVAWCAAWRRWARQLASDMLSQLALNMEVLNRLEVLLSF